MHLILIQLNHLYASREDVEKPKLLFPPAIVQVNVSYQKNKIAVSSQGGAEILNFKNCRWVFLQRVPQLPRFCLLVGRK